MIGVQMTISKHWFQYRLDAVDRQAHPTMNWFESIWIMFKNISLTWEKLYYQINGDIAYLPMIFFVEKINFNIKSKLQNRYITYIRDTCMFTLCMYFLTCHFDAAQRPDPTTNRLHSLALERPGCMMALWHGYTFSITDLCEENFRCRWISLTNGNFVANLNKQSICRWLETP